MKKILFIIPFFLWACGGGDSTGSSDVEIPVIKDINIQTEEDQAVNFSMPLTNGSSNGLNYFYETKVQNGTIFIRNGTATYTPNENFNGTDFFTYRITNGSDTSSLGNVSISITPVNDPPIVEDVSLWNGQYPQANLIGNDIDNNDISFEIIQEPNYGTASIVGDIVYYSGNTENEDSFTYYANDGEATSNIGTVTVKVSSKSTEQRLISKTYPKGGSQKFTNGRQYAYDLAQSHVGSILLAGLSGNHPNEAGYIVKIDSQNSNQILTKNYDFTSSSDYFNSIDDTEDGGFILSGFSDYKALLLKVNSEGQQEWYKRFGGDGNNNGQRAIELNDGSFLFAISLHNTDNSWSLYIIKTDSNGEEVWSNKISIEGENQYYWSVYPKGILETNDGYLIGSNANLVNSPGSERGAVLTKIDFNGNLVLNKIIEDWGELESIVPTSSGFVGTGFTGSSPIIFKIDESGDEIWSYSLNQNAVLRNPVEVDDGGYIFCGFKFMGSGDEDIFILRTDSFGNQIWAKAYHDKEGETDIGHSYSMIKLNDGNYGAVGLSVKDGNYSEADIAFIKIDTDGNEID